MLHGTCLCGACTWSMDARPASATSCDCSACSRYGAIWAYGYKGEDVNVSGPVRAFLRSDLEETNLTFDTCSTCGVLLAWTGLAPGADGRTRQAINLRLASLNDVKDIPVSHHEGLNNFGQRTVRGSIVDIWF